MRHVALAAFAAFVSIAPAGVQSITITGGHENAVGEIVAPAPGVVGKNNFQDFTLRAFDELQNVTLEQDLVLGDRTIAAGTTVNSTAVVWDPANGALVYADILFEGDILGVATTREELRLTDSLFALDTVDYRDPKHRGLEKRDSSLISGSTLSIDFRASSPGDFIRVLTVIPTPGSAMALAVGFAVMARRKR
ncbi:MAG: hypothetical protein AAGI53_06175 [Planctomycetota bacterium]